MGINGLPVDVLVRIFEMVSRRPQSSLDVKCEPWSLGQVCSGWRQIALQSHALWSTVVLSPSLMTNVGSASALAILEEYLLRSADHPLQIAFMGASSDTENYNAVLEARVLDSLISRSRRWRIVEFIADSESMYHISTILAHRDLSALEEFYLKRSSSSSQEGMQPQAEIATIFMNAPRIHKADYRDTFLVPAPNPNAAVTHLGCKIGQISDIRHILTYSSLRELHILNHSSSFENRTFPPALMPTVEQLAVKTSRILNFLTLPNLVTLAIREQHQSARHNLTAFMERSDCSLRVLSLLSGQLLSWAGLSGKPYHLVERITLPVPQLIEASMGNLSDPSILPSLRTITVMVSGLQFAQPKLRSDFIRFLTKRFEMTKLKLVRMYCLEEDFGMLMENGARQLQEAGLSIVLDTFNSDHDDWQWWKGPYWFPVVNEPS